MDHSTKRILLEEVIFYGILTKLPTKSLSRFMCVNKSWCDWISSPQFQKLHLLNQNSSSKLTEDDFIVLATSDDDRLFSLPNIEWNDHNFNSIKDGGALQEMDYPLKSPITLVHIEGSCNGLLLMVIYTGVRDPSKCLNFYIWNPCKKDDYIALPQPQPSCLSPGKYHWLHVQAVGFCYDSISDDYKVIFIVSRRDSNYANEGIIYTTKTNTWRKITRVPQDINIHDRGYFTNGVVLWLARRKVYDDMRSLHVRGERDRTLVACFDIGSEEWREIPLTMDFEGDYELGPQFSITSRGKLYMSYTYYHYGDINPLAIEFHTKVHEMIDKGEFAELWSLQSGDFFVRKVEFMADNMVLVHADNYNDNDGEFALYNFVQAKRLTNTFVEVLRRQPFSRLNWLEAVRYCRSLVSPRQLIKFAG